MNGLSNSLPIEVKCSTRPLLKTRKFSKLHLEIFEQMLLTGKSNRELNRFYGYTIGSHQVVDHSRTVMYKLLALENLGKKDFKDQVIYPRRYKFWWKQLFDIHKHCLLKTAVKPEFYGT